MDKRYIYLKLFCLYGIFLIIWILFGAKEYSDTIAYLNASTVVPPLYSLLLQMCSAMGKNYLQVVALLQNMLAAFSIFFVSEYISNRFKVNRIVNSIITIIFILPYFITAIFSKSHMLISNAILTEGITYSLYNIYIYFMLKGLLEEKNVHFLKATLIVVILTLTKNQAFLLIPTIFGVFLTNKDCIRKTFSVSLLVLLLGIVMIVVGNRLLYRTLTGEWMTSDRGSATILTQMIYVSEDDSSDSWSDDNLKGIFKNMRKQVNSQHLSHNDVKYTDYARDIYSYHDKIKAITIKELRNSAISKNLSGIDSTNYQNEIAIQLWLNLFKRNWWKWLGLYCVMVWVGLVKSIAIYTSFFPYLSAFIYVFAVVLLLKIIRDDGNSQSAKCMMLSLMMTISMVFGTAFVIVCLQRYVLFNFSFFWVSLFLMFREYVLGFRRKKCDV